MERDKISGCCENSMNNLLYLQLFVNYHYRENICWFGDVLCAMFEVCCFLLLMTSRLGSEIAIFRYIFYTSYWTIVGLVITTITHSNSTQTYEILLLVLALALTHLGTKHELISFGCQCIFTLLRLLILLAVPLWTKSKVRLLSGTHWYNHWGQASRPLSVICGSEVDMWVINHVCYSLSKVQQEH